MASGGPAGDLRRSPSAGTPLPRWWRWRHSGAVACLALTLAALPLVTGLTVDNSLEVWIERDSRVYGYYQSFLDLFGSEEFILVIYPLPAVPDLEFLEQLTDLRLSIEEVDGVHSVLDIARVYSRTGGFQDLQGFDRDLRSSPLYRSFLVSTDGSKAATWITLEVGQSSHRVSVVDAVEQAVGETMADIPVHFAGSPVVNAALDEATDRASRIFFPLVFVLSGLVLALLYRDPVAVLIPFLSVGAGIVWTLAVIVLSGRSLNMVTAALPPLVWVLGLSTSIHLLSTCSRRGGAGRSPAESIVPTVRELTRPCFYSALTTAIGFLSLAFSSMRPVREMGIFAAIGVLFCLASNFLLFPVLAERWMARRSADDHTSLLTVRGMPRITRLLQRLALSTQRHRQTVILVSLALALTAIVGISRLQADSNVVGFFKADSPISVTYNQVLRDFTGHQSLEIVLRPPADPISPATFAAVDALGRRIGDESGVVKVLSAVDLVKSAHRQATGAPAEAYELPVDELEFQDAWEMAGRLLPEERRSLYSPDTGTLRLTALVTPLGAAANKTMVEAIRRDIDELIDPSWETGTTGLVQLLLDMQRRLLYSQIQSLAAAFLIIGPVLTLLLRSLRYGLLCLLVNLLPVVLALGFMGFSGIPLDPATVMIAGIALGIAVDDSIHFLTRYRRRRLLGDEVAAAIHSAFDSVGPPMLTTSVVASLGFFVLCFSSFGPLFDFGLLTGLTMGAALAASLVLLPSLLMQFDRGTMAPDTGPA